MRGGREIEDCCKTVHEAVEFQIEDRNNREDPLRDSQVWPVGSQVQSVSGCSQLTQRDWMRQDALVPPENLQIPWEMETESEEAVGDCLLN